VGTSSASRCCRLPCKHRNVPIGVLTADDLGRAGFTTLTGSRVRQQSADDEHDRPPAPSTDAGKISPGAHSMGKSDSAPNVHAGESVTPRGDMATDQSSVVSDLSTVTVELGRDEAGSPVTWEVSTKGSPHAFILGIPGQGKSVTTRRIVNQFACQGLPSLVFDFHGDMAADPPPRAHVIDASTGLPFSPFEISSGDPRIVSQTAWEVAEIVAYVCGLGEIQRNHVYKGLRMAYLNSGDTDNVVVPTMAQFADAVEQVEHGSRGRNVHDRIRPLTEFGLFADDPGDTFQSTWGNGIVVDLSHLNLETVQLAASAFLLKKSIEKCSAGIRRGR
jgi:DNA phosphorothioation-dependent restriction protein DptH